MYFEDLLLSGGILSLEGSVVPIAELVKKIQTSPAGQVLNVPIPVS
jgi:hypothetical protein